MKTPILAAVIACAGSFAGRERDPPPCPATPPKPRASRRRPSSRSSRRPTGASTRCTASCSCATARSSPRAGGRRTTPRRPHALYSLSKSFTSTAVGLAVAEGKLSVDDQVLKFFPDDAPAEPSEQPQGDARAATCCACPPGHQAEPSLRRGRARGPKTFLAQPVPHKPGTHFLYNTPATYMLSAIVQKVDGADRARLPAAAPVRAAGHREPDLGDQPAGRLARRLRPERPHRGHRQVRPALPPEGEVARQAARPRGVGRGGHGAADLQRQQPEERLGPGLRLPVLALPPRRVPRRRRVRPVLHRPARAGRRDRHHQRREGHAGGPEPRLGQAPPGHEGRPPGRPTTPGAQALGKHARGPDAPPPSGSGSPGAMAKVGGKTYVFPANDRKLESIRLESETATTRRLIARFDGVDRRIACGQGSWTKGARWARRLCRSSPPRPAARWTADDTFTAKVCFYETPFIVTMALKFDGDSFTFGPSRTSGSARRGRRRSRARPSERRRRPPLQQGGRPCPPAWQFLGDVMQAGRDARPAEEGRARVRSLPVDRLHRLRRDSGRPRRPRAAGSRRSAASSSGVRRHVRPRRGCRRGT